MTKFEKCSLCGRDLRKSPWPEDRAGKTEGPCRHCLAMEALGEVDRIFATQHAATWEDTFAAPNNDFTDLVTSVDGVECAGACADCDSCCVVRLNHAPLRGSSNRSHKITSSLYG